MGLPKQKRSAYARNRDFLRIMPAYWVVLTVAAIVPGFYGAFTGNWWVYYGLLQSFPIVNSPREPVWSISSTCGLPGRVEPRHRSGCFYIALPFFDRGHGRPRVPVRQAGPLDAPSS